MCHKRRFLSIFENPRNYVNIFFKSIVQYVVLLDNTSSASSMQESENLSRFVTPFIDWLLMHIRKILFVMTTTTGNAFGELVSNDADLDEFARLLGDLSRFTPYSSRPTCWQMDRASLTSILWFTQSVKLTLFFCFFLRTRQYTFWWGFRGHALSLVEYVSWRCRLIWLCRRHALE